MYTNLPTGQNHEIGITLILCECCYDVLLEDDTEYVNGKAICHHCLATYL